MKKEHWDDKRIEELLHKTPKMHDERSKEEVLQRLRESNVFQHQEDQVTVVQKRFHWKPLLVSIASLFVIVFIISNYMGNSPELQMSTTTQDEASDTSSMEQSAINNSPGEARMELANADVRTALYADQLTDETVFTIGLAGDDAESVPVTFVIPNDRIKEDFNGITPTKLQLYTFYAPLIDEQSIGFADYHPLTGLLTEQGNQLTHALQADHVYDVGTASLANYSGVLIDTFSNSYEEVTITHEDGSTSELNHIGEVAELIKLTGKTTQYNYFLYTMRNGEQYLSPNFRMSYDNVIDALYMMTEEANDIYQTVILPNVEFDVTEDGEHVIVRFTDSLDLQLFNSPEVMHMLEGMLLTAASFDKQVRFENIVQEEWNGFQLLELQPIPLGPNKFEFPIN